MPDLTQTLTAALGSLFALVAGLGLLSTAFVAGAWWASRARPDADVLSSVEKAATGDARRERDEALTQRDEARAEVASLRALLRELMGPAPLHHDRREVRHGAR